ncbi:MAG TPA: Crp/Fnr family transcriptional regulator [Piscinibacter sp.]|mgnify:CR=1 FL=1|nr:Crp/Fnr family transcriptional regulator [Piscinibacter sp.]
MKISVEALIDELQRTRDPAIVCSFLPTFRPRTWRAGEVLMQQGVSWTDAFFIERGLLRVHTLESDGRDYSKSFWPEGTMVLPLTPQMQEQPSSFMVSAVEATRAWQAPWAQFRDALDARALWQSLCNLMLARLLDQKQQREHTLLALDGRERYLRLCQQQPDVAKRVPLVHLASYLGLTDVSLSRIRRQIRNASV